jgi:hypothetical protein
VSAGPRPEPPLDIHARSLPLRTFATRVLYRIHRSSHNPLFFGPPAGAPESRFDDPEGAFQVCYLGEQREAALVEALLREPTRTLVAWSDFEARQLATVTVTRTLRLVEFLGSALRRLGATAEVGSTRDYSLSQAWSRALWTHPAQPDGIVYRCRHYDSVRGIALFDRARRRIGLLDAQPLTMDTRWLGEMSERYGFGLVL